MADLTTIRNALAAQITAQTGLRTMAQPRDQVSPPVAVIIPREPVITFGDTMDGSLTVNLTAVLLLSDAPPSEKTQRALDAYLGLGAGETVSIAGAVQADPSLGGAVHSTLPVSVSSYSRVVYADVTYFGARVNFEIITI
jgi:hypothetical protein